MCVYFVSVRKKTMMLYVMSKGSLRRVAVRHQWDSQNEQPTSIMSDCSVKTGRGSGYGDGEGAVSGVMSDIESVDERDREPVASLIRRIEFDKQLGAAAQDSEVSVE